MFYFNPYSLPFFAASVVLIFSGTYVLLKNLKGKLNGAFFGWCVSAFVWLFSYAIAFSSSNERLSYLFIRIGSAGVFLLPSTYFYFIANFIGNSKEINFSRIFLIFFSLISLATLLTNKLIVGVYSYYFGFYGKGSLLYFICVILFTIPIFRAMYVLVKFIRTKNLEDKKMIQAKYLFISFLVSSFSCIDFLPKFGIEFYPLGWFFFSVWIVAIAYAVLAHNLLAVDIVIKKGFIYSALVLIITLIYLISVVSTGKLFQGLSGIQSFWMNLFFILIAAVLFNPLRQRIQKFIDKRFFFGTLESLDQERRRLQQDLFQAEKLAYVGSLASSVAHEIRNPLTVIKTHLEYLPQKYQDQNFRNNFERLIPQEIDRMEKIVNQLLTLAKPRMLISKPLNIVEVVDSTLLLLDNNFKLKNIIVKRDFGEREMFINGDEEQLRQVFLNLFINAIQAMSEDGILTVRTTSDEQRITINIGDTGCGISEGNLAKLFMPFRTTKKDGIGLGLAITKEIIEVHKGKIRVESKVGEGTKFIIELTRVNL